MHERGQAYAAEALKRAPDGGEVSGGRGGDVVAEGERDDVGHARYFEASPAHEEDFRSVMKNRVR